MIRFDRILQNLLAPTRARPIVIQSLLLEIRGESLARVWRAHLDSATGAGTRWRSAGFRPGVFGARSDGAAGPEVGAPVAVSRCTRTLTPCKIRACQPQPA